MRLKQLTWKEQLLIWNLDETALEFYDLPRYLRDACFVPKPVFLTVVIDGRIKGVLACPNCESDKLKKNRYFNAQLNLCLDCGLEFKEEEGEVK